MRCMTLCVTLRSCLAVKFDSCNNLISFVHTILVDILRYVRLYIRNEKYIISNINRQPQHILPFKYSDCYITVMIEAIIIVSSPICHCPFSTKCLKSILFDYGVSLPVMLMNYILVMRFTHFHSCYFIITIIIIIITVYRGYRHYSIVTISVGLSWTCSI